MGTFHTWMEYTPRNARFTRSTSALHFRREGLSESVKTFKSKTFLFAFLATAFLASLITLAKEKTEVKTWIDPELAASEHPGFAIQGEYAGGADASPLGVQVASLDQGKFLLLTYQGGLPGAGWDGGPLKSEVLETAGVKALIEPLKKVERKSDTLGKKAPEGAIVVFDGEPTEFIQGEIKDGLFWAGGKTTKEVGDFHMHIEFRLPFKPGRVPSSQDRGNSGVYIYDNYECQVIDSFGLDFRSENNAIDLQSLNTQWCGCFYKFKTPDQPMAFPPLAWQTYDIDFTAPRFEGEEKVKNARITVRHNGVVIHDDVELPKGTGAGGNRPEKAKGIINFQGHGNPVAFRNIWIQEK